MKKQRLISKARIFLSKKRCRQTVTVSTEIASNENVKVMLEFVFKSTIKRPRKLRKHMETNY